MKYLYGVSIKKIQSYIFNSSKLKNIAGASELVDYLCTDFFDEFIKDKKKDIQTIIQAAGNIRVIINNEETAKFVMLNFLKQVSKKAPGIQIVQAIIELPNDKITAKDSWRLEDELKKQLPLSIPFEDWSSITKFRETGKCITWHPTVEKKDKDLETAAKLAAVDKHWTNLKNLFKTSFTDNIKFPSEAKEIAGTDNFLAVIHADGNSLGKTLMQLAKDENYDKKWPEFSRQLDIATKNAAKLSYQKNCAKLNKFRPIILGGDDLTVICAAEDAIPFTIDYLNFFKEECAKSTVLGKLTACAGIAFIKANYPFYYGVRLAEILCSETKKRAKACSENPVPSSFMFAKELGSFIDSSFSAREKRLLSISTGNEKISFAFGPYKTSEDEEGGETLPDANTLLTVVQMIKNNKDLALHSGLRKLLTELHVSIDSAKFNLERIEEITEDKGKSQALNNIKLQLSKLTMVNEKSDFYSILINSGKSPLIDILTAYQFLQNNNEE